MLALLSFSKGRWLCGTKAFSHKPPKPRSMKMLFTSSHNWKRNGLTMFSRARLLRHLGNFLAFVSPLDRKEKRKKIFPNETFNSIADSNCFKEHTEPSFVMKVRKKNLNHANSLDGKTSEEQMKFNLCQIRRATTKTKLFKFAEKTFNNFHAYYRERQTPNDRIAFQIQ